MVLSHFNETFGRPTVLCFRKLLVSKMLRIKDGGCNQAFPSKLFCLTVPIHFVDKHFRVPQKKTVSKLIIDKRGGLSWFSVEHFLSLNTQEIVGHLSSVSEKNLITKNLWTTSAGVGGREYQI